MKTNERAGFKGKRRREQTKRVSRRRFLRDAAVAGTLAIVPRHVLGGTGHVAPSEKTTLAGIGLGGQGSQNITALMQYPEVQVVAVCDVNREGGGYQSWNWTEGKEQRTAGREPARRAVEEFYAKEKGLGRYRGCRGYADYRELLAKEKVDAVMIATPDHSHAVITMAALKLGKHVYCEKPLAWSVHEIRLVTETARKAGVATQLGNHGQATEEARLVREIIADGAIGAVHEVQVWSPARFWALPAVRRPARGNAAGPRGTRLGPVAWPGPEPPLSSGLLPLDLAELVGLRHRPAGRLGMPQAVDRVQGPAARPSLERRGLFHRDGRRDLSGGRDGATGVPRPRRHAAGANRLVRRRFAAARAQGIGAGPHAGRRHLLRREGRADGPSPDPGGEDAGLRPAAEEAAAFARPLQGIRRRLPRRRTGRVELCRSRRPAERGLHVGQRRPAGRQEARLGRAEHESHQRRGRQPLAPPRVPAGLGADY